MHRTPTTLLSAVTLVAALGFVGCTDQPRPVAPSSPNSTPGDQAALPTIAPTPPVDQLTGVLYRLADTSIPAEQKVALVQYATVDDQATLANFGQALKDSGFDPLTVDATDVAWAGQPGDVLATVTMGSPDPRAKPFTFPMEFAPMRDGWQLSKRTADQLLPLVGSPAPPPP